MCAHIVNLFTQEGWFKHTLIHTHSLFGWTSVRIRVLLDSVGALFWRGMNIPPDSFSVGSFNPVRSNCFHPCRLIGFISTKPLHRILIFYLLSWLHSKLPFLLTLNIPFCLWLELEKFHSVLPKRTDHFLFQSSPDNYDLWTAQ